MIEGFIDGVKRDIFLNLILHGIPGFVDDKRWFAAPSSSKNLNVLEVAVFAVNCNDMINPNVQPRFCIPIFLCGIKKRFLKMIIIDFSYDKTQK